MTPSPFADDLDRERARQARERQQRWKGRYRADLLLAALRDWADAHGRPPSRTDWSAARDPHNRWPRATRVSSVFERVAVEDGRRRLVQIRCVDCHCIGYVPARDGMLPFTEERGCPHGPRGRWKGVGGWEYALELAGLEPGGPGRQRTGGAERRAAGIAEAAAARMRAAAELRAAQAAADRVAPSLAEPRG